MIIKLILIFGLTLVLLYALLQRSRSPYISITMSLVSLAGIYFVWFPESTNELAHIVGVGRGADLVIYCWLIISLIIPMNLQFKILQLQSAITILVREQALQHVQGTSDHRHSQDLMQKKP